jgi:hypothetical protein
MPSERRVHVYSPPEPDLPPIVAVVDEDNVVWTVAASCAEEAEILAALYRRTHPGPPSRLPDAGALRPCQT